MLCPMKNPCGGVFNQLNTLCQYVAQKRNYVK